MRGNTTAKRDVFAKKEKEQGKPEVFTKIDNNVIVNKALINDNYDKAKMALEEIISERQKRNNSKEQDATPALNESTGDESYVRRVQQRKKAMKDADVEDKKIGFRHSLQEADLKERLGDLRDHNHMRHILSQTEPRSEEAYKSTRKTSLPSVSSISNEPKSPIKTYPMNIDYKLTNNPVEGDERGLERRLSEDSMDNAMDQNNGRRWEAPPIPPRNKKETGVDVSTTKEKVDLKDLAEKDAFETEEKYSNGVIHLKEAGIGAGQQEVESDLRHSETFSAIKQRDVSTDLVNNGVCGLVLPEKYPQSENVISSSENENKAMDMCSIEFGNDRTQELYTVKRKAPLQPDHLNTPDNNTSSHIVDLESDTINRTSEDINTDSEIPNEGPGKMISPLLLVNGVSINQSPPDHASLSSKSSYFSVESALHRNTESDSNVYHSLENLISEVEEFDEIKQNLVFDKTEADYYSLSDHEKEPDVVKQLPKKESEVPFKCAKEGDNALTDQCPTQEEQHDTPMSPSNTFSPSLGIPALFKVKDNTFSNKPKKSVQPWSPRGSLSVSVKGEEELHQLIGNLKLPLINEPANQEITPVNDEIFTPKEISSPPPLLLSPPNLQTENQKKPPAGMFLTVPQEEDRFSGVSPSSEGVESFTTSAADTADEMGANDELLVEFEASKIPSEQSGSPCSGNDSQTGLPRPPAVLPKSEKAVLRAIKLTTRRMKKEEAQKSQHKSSGSKHRSDRHKGEQKSSRNSKSSDRKHREKAADGHDHREGHHGKDSNDRSEQQHCQKNDYSGEKHQLDRKDTIQEIPKQKRDLLQSNNQKTEALPSVATERQGRSNSRRIPEKPQQRHYSSDRVISNVPVYKAHVSDKPTSERLLQRSLSSDRYLGDKLERRLSTDMAANERLDPRSQRIEKSIMDEFQQRGRGRDKPSRDNPLRRSHSIDAYSTEVHHPAALSRQSSHTSHSSQLSRQSSIEHAIVTQSFPMTQRKLLQDPDSGQYFFVDMPVQVKTKTFFDPETGSYVQLPVQPPEGAVPQASPLEVLTPPLVVYHGFVPVPLSPMAQTAPIQASHMTAEEFEQRHLERSRQMHCTDRHQYLEPVYGQHDHMLGEFLGTEELDCPS